jgi:hypothetical protein
MIVRLLKMTAVLVAVLLALPAAAQPTAAGSQAVFTIRDVAVDRTAATAAAAREAALLEAQRTALRRVLERLVPRSEHRRLPNLSDARIGDLVENFEVQSERTSPVRYIATLTYRFRPEEVRTLLRNANISFAETSAKPYLVLPVLVQAGLALLWDDPNPWRAAWGRRPPSDGLAPIALPAGNLADISDINAEQARRGEDARIAAMSARYGTAGVLVAEAALDRSSGGRTVVQVSVSRYGGVAGEQTFVESYAAEAGEDDDTLLTRAAAATARGIEERWKGEQLIRFGREARLTVIVTYEDVAEWAAIRRRLGEMTIVRRSDVVWIMRHEALVDLSYVGDENQLRLALAQRDLDLSQRQNVGDVQWRLTLASPSAPAPRNAGRPRR